MTDIIRHWVSIDIKKVTTVAAFWSAVVDRLNTDVIIRLTHLSTLQGALVRRFCILGTVTCVYIEPLSVTILDNTLPAVY